MATNTEYLETVPLFRGLSGALRERLAERCVRAKLSKNEALFEQGSEGHALYIVIAGRLRIEQSGPEGDTQTVAIRGAGDVIGEFALLDATRRSASAIAMSACRLLILNRADFQEFVLNHPQASLALMQILAQRVREASDRLVEMRTTSVEERLIADLQANGEANFQQTLWAERIGCSREVLNRSLAKLIKEGTVSRVARGHYQFEGRK